MIHTGIFTASVRGLYYFRFTTCGQLQSNQVTGAHLYKNDQAITFVAEWDTHGYFRYASNAAVLQLEVGDIVYIQLPKTYRVFGDKTNVSTFSGFLVSPL